MLKRIIALLLIVLMVLTFCACGDKVPLHCDRCGKEVKGDKKMTEDWIIFCADCQEELGPIIE